MAFKTDRVISHYERKDAAEAAKYQEIRKQTNALRGKQVYDVETKEYKRVK